MTFTFSGVTSERIDHECVYSVFHSHLLSVLSRESVRYAYRIKRSYGVFRKDTLASLRCYTKHRQKLMCMHTCTCTRRWTLVPSLVLTLIQILTALSSTAPRSCRWRAPPRSIRPATSVGGLCTGVCVCVRSFSRTIEQVTWALFSSPTAVWI